MKFVVALALFGLLLLAGCARTGFIGDPESPGYLEANKAYCADDMRFKLKIERDRCFHNLAWKMKDESICAEIKAEAGLGGGSVIPGVIIEDMVTKNIRNDCYFEVAERKAKEGLGSASAIADICENIKGENDEAHGESGNMLLRDNCFYEVAVNMLAPEICDRISEKATKESMDVDADGSVVHVEKSYREVCREDIERKTST